MNAAIRTVFVLLLLTLPMTAGARIYYDSANGKLHFAFYIYDKLRIISGVVRFGKKAAEIAIRNKKIEIPYAKMFEGGKKFDVFAGFDMTEIYGILELGAAEDPVRTMAIANAYVVMSNLLLGALKRRNYMAQEYSCAEIYAERSGFKFNFGLAFAFNPALIIIAIVKKLTENIINGKRAK